MTSAQELYEEWTNGDDGNGMRPSRVQELRDEIAEATGMTVPHRRGDIEHWLETMTGSGVLTRKLRAAAEGPDEDEAGADETEDSDDD